MFDNNVYIENSTRNFTCGGHTEGFELQTYITYYRGIPCSMVHNVAVTVDGTEVPRENILFSIDGEDFFTLSELETVTDYKWEYGEPATVRVITDGGLSHGKHEITLELSVRVAYVPVPFTGKKTRTVEI